MKDLEGVQINYDKFKSLLQYLGFIDLKKSSPLDMALASDMWTLDLNPKNDSDDAAYAENVLILLAAM